MKMILKNLIILIQRSILIISYHALSIFYFKSKKTGIVIGVRETASVLKNLNKIIPNSISVNKLKNKYYSFNYDHDLSNHNKIVKGLMTPLLFAFLINKNNLFIYINEDSFLSYNDGRNFEFNFLKKKNCKIICYFTGSDIRSIKLLNEFGIKNNIDVITTYQCIYSENTLYDHEKLKEKLAISADRYADLIFNPNVDQMSYIKRKTEPFLYFLDKDQFTFKSEKYTNTNKIKILHAPSDPIIKGTPLVRAAIKKLLMEGYNFEYIELINKSNEEVKVHLEDAHIVLNQFYAFVPGIFGIEALMSGCILLTSADKTIETSLFDGANSAWLVTKYWEIYENLKYVLLMDTDQMIKQATIGRKWAEKYCSYEFSQNYLNRKFMEIGLNSFV